MNFFNGLQLFFQKSFQKQFHSNVLCNEFQSLFKCIITVFSPRMICQNCISYNPFTNLHYPLQCTTSFIHSNLVALLWMLRGQCIGGNSSILPACPPIQCAARRRPQSAKRIFFLWKSKLLLNFIETKIEWKFCHKWTKIEWKSVLSAVLANHWQSQICKLARTKLSRFERVKSFFVQDWTNFNSGGQFEIEECYGEAGRFITVFPFRSYFSRVKRSKFVANYHHKHLGHFLDLENLCKCDIGFRRRISRSFFLKSNPYEDFRQSNKIGDYK